MSFGTSHKREEALRSALERLPLAVLLCDGSQTLQPMNAAGRALFAREGLAGDLPSARPSHPIAALIRDTLENGAPSVDAADLTLPSGARYSVEVSRRSERGRERWLLMILQPVAVPAPSRFQDLFDSWGLTRREIQVAEMLASGASSPQMASELQVSEATLRTHVRHLLQKSATSSRSEFLGRLLRGR